MAEGENDERIDARILGQLLVAQNLLFVLPNEDRIAEYYAQALAEIPGAKSCFICLGASRSSADWSKNACGECSASWEQRGGISVRRRDAPCLWESERDTRVIALRTSEALLGFFVFKIERLEAFAPYEPFLHNLANYMALSLEGRMQRRLLEEARDELEAKNRELEELNRCFVGRELRMLELKEKIAALEGKDCGVLPGDRES